MECPQTLADAADEILQLELALGSLFEFEMLDAEREHNRAGHEGLSPRSNLAVLVAAQARPHGQLD